MSEKEKSTMELLKETLLESNKNGYDRMSDEEIQKCYDYCEGYKAFLNQAKTEREACAFTINVLEQQGFVAYEGQALKTGDKIYQNNRGKAIIAAVIGSEDIAKGVHICAAHIDSPRLDLKQHPLYEQNELALLKTHYYGGIKKYQWTAIPLALHGVICKADGEKVTVSVGEEETDPVFCISDLLPHLAMEQMSRKPGELIRGEELNILIGSRPFKDDKGSEKVKLAIMQILNEKYGITEADFISAELELVPAFKAKDIGFDKSMIGSYGHDDRVCAYPTLTALLECKNPKKTAVMVLTDKEEIGSDGNTGLCAAYLRYFIEDIAENMGSKGRIVLSHSQCLSSDVNAAYDPTFSSVFENQNSAYLNHGVVLTKYTGARGKSGSSDASAEYVSEIRTLLDNNDVVWQTGELGKVDAGGGGTVAAYIANLDVDTVDMGVPVLSMHAPYEVVAKVDTYMAHKAFRAFFEA